MYWSWQLYREVWYTGFGSYIGRCDILDLAAIQFGVIYWSWQLYSTVWYTGVGSYTVRCVILELAILITQEYIRIGNIQCNGTWFTWQLDSAVERTAIVSCTVQQDIPHLTIESAVDSIEIGSVWELYIALVILKCTVIKWIRDFYTRIGCTILWSCRR